jgi:hypothetical protein
MQRVNAPAGEMQLKGLIEAYVVCEWRSVMRNKCYKLCVSNVGHHLTLLPFGILKEKNG